MTDAGLFRLIRETVCGWACVALLVAGCAGETETTDLDTSRPSEFGYQVTPRTTRLVEGKKTYESYCIGCHGKDGRGDGEAARFLYPRPRNFQKAQFKFMSTRFGQLPTDDDLRRTITYGLKGSAMPAWGQLGARRIDALIEYIKTFSDVWDAPPAPPIPFVTDPYAGNPDKSAAIQRGEIAYHGFFSCWNCHPAYVKEEKLNEYIVAMGGRAKPQFRPHLHQSAIKSDSSGKTIFAPDFERDQIKSGFEVKDLYRTIAAGITGTAMPTWVDTAAEAPMDDSGKPLATRADIWAMAYYVQNLIKQRTIKFKPGELPIRDNRKLVFGEQGMEYVAKEQSAEGEEEFFDDQ